MNTKVDVPRRTKRELKDFALQAARGEIYVAWTKAQVEGSFGMFLAMAGDVITKQYNVDSIGLIYTDKPNDHDKYKALNGHPIYWRGAILNRKDSELVRGYYQKLQERMEEPSWFRRTWRKIKKWLKGRRK